MVVIVVEGAEAVEGAAEVEGDITMIWVTVVTPVSAGGVVTIVVVTVTAETEARDEEEGRLVLAPVVSVARGSVVVVVDEPT